MAFDGAFLHSVILELKSAEGCHVDKIYQPSRDELVLLLRKKGFVKRLLISARSGGARIQFTEGKYENPETPPMFCMLARKIFSASRLVLVSGKGLERIVELTFDTANEMGDRISPKIVCELIGNSSNIILVGDDGKIYDAARRSDIETAKRIIQPGAKYEYPPTQDKLDFLNGDMEHVLDTALAKGGLLSKALLDTADGLSPLICREVAYTACGDDVACDEVSDRSLIVKTLEDIRLQILNGGTPTVFYKADNTPADFSYIDIKQYGNTYTKKTFGTPSELLDAFYFERDLLAAMHRGTADISRLVTNLIARANRRLNLRLHDMREGENREQLRIFGELIKANIHAIPAGSTVARVHNFYDEELKVIEIPLDPAKNAAQNAAKYFKDYKKSCAAVQTLEGLIEEDKREIEYLSSVEESISRCRSSADIAEIREELAQGGYIKKQNGKRQKKVQSKIEEHQSKEGYRILVGKNNTQNDYITTALAAKGDMWFHTKGIHGSHVVVMCGGAPLSDETVIFAAQLAAYNSKARSSSNVPVDYTPVKFVKKPNGAKAGMVIYTTNKTVFVTPKEEN